MEDTEGLGSLPNASKYEGSQRKTRLLGQKLSLKSDERSEESMKIVKQDPVAGHFPSTAGSTYPIACSSDVSGRLNGTPENMSASTTIGVVSKKEDQGNKKNLQLPGQTLSITSEAPSQRSDGNYMLPYHLPASACDVKDNTMQSSDDIPKNSLERSISGSSESSYKPLDGNRRNIRTLGRKLSLKSVKPEKKSDDQDENVAPDDLPSQLGFNNLQKRPLDAISSNAMQSSYDIPKNSLERSIGGSSESSYRPLDGNRRNIRTLGRKLSLKSVKPEKKSDDQDENVAPDDLPSQLGFNNLQKRPLDAISRKNFSGDPVLVQQNPNTEHQPSDIQMVANEECDQGRKMLCLLSRKRLSLKSERPGVDSASDEHKPPKCSLSGKKPNELLSSALPTSIPKGDAMAPNELQLSVPGVLKSQAKALGSAGEQKNTNSGNSSVKQNAVAMETIVVSDSEDSADEDERRPRSRLSLMRRRLAGKLRN